MRSTQDREAWVDQEDCDRLAVAWAGLVLELKAIHSVGENVGKNDESAFS
jgi:hypothetical protein